jgi:peptide methionine sulfoxide reductase msrA/msrB
MGSTVRWISWLTVSALVASVALAEGAGPTRPAVISKTTYRKPSLPELQKRLSPLALEVTQRAGTEPPFRNPLWDHHAEGLYVDVVTGEPLFSSTDKFDSGTGWPSFTRPVEDGRVVNRVDSTHGMVRTEVRSRSGDSHLGHLFDDGPPPSGARYCINSAALSFVPVDRLEEFGYGAYLALFPGQARVGVKVLKGGAPPRLETAYLAGGCFWGMEDILRQIPGVLFTEVGYAGGKTAQPTYSDVKGGDTGHAESVKILFDPRRLSYADLLEKWFFRMHDPTTPNRQGNDVGTQYRSAIFVTSPEQRQVALAVKERVGKSGKWSRPIVTEITDAGPFTRAEEYHQDYLQKNPGGYTCHYLRE